MKRGVRRLRSCTRQLPGSLQTLHVSRRFWRQREAAVPLAPRSQQPVVGRLGPTDSSLCEAVVQAWALCRQL